MIKALQWVSYSWYDTDFTCSEESVDRLTEFVLMLSLPEEGDKSSTLQIQSDCC